MRLSRDHITTLRQTRLAIRRATRCTAIRIPRCRLPGVAKRVARHLPAHTSAAAPGGGPAHAAATAAQKTATKRHIRGIAAEEPEEVQVLAVPAETGQPDARRRGALDAGLPTRLDWQTRRGQARVRQVNTTSFHEQSQEAPRERARRGSRLQRSGASWLSSTLNPEQRVCR